MNPQTIHYIKSLRFDAAHHRKALADTERELYAMQDKCEHVFEIQYGKMSSGNVCTICAYYEEID